MDGAVQQLRCVTLRCQADQYQRPGPKYKAIPKLEVYT